VTVLAESVDDLVQRIRHLAAGRPRTMIGLTGAPGAGKSTTCAALIRALAPDAVLVPMDGFHLANAELERLGRRDRKGAPDTFDAAGYVNLLQRIRARADDPVYAPEFDRSIEEAVAGAVRVDPATPVVLTEGNYLLLDEHPWSGVRTVLDEVWYVDADPDLRVERLIRRHVQFGKSPERAREWVLRSDEANAALVVPGRARADVVVML
jgi:pantothenate kinase